MAIDTGAAIDFFGSLTALGNTTSSVSNDAFSDGTNDLTAWTNSDDAKEATAVLEFTTATTGDAGSVINLYAVLIDVGNAGTEDSEVPDANFPNIYLGSFPHNNPSTSAQTAPIPIALPNAIASQVYNFYIENKTGQTISASWELTIRPKATGPHA
jgi:hypothetical protein